MHPPLGGAGPGSCWKLRRSCVLGLARGIAAGSPGGSRAAGWAAGGHGCGRRQGLLSGARPAHANHQGYHPMQNIASAAAGSGLWMAACMQGHGTKLRRVTVKQTTGACARAAAGMDGHSMSCRVWACVGVDNSCASAHHAAQHFGLGRHGGGACKYSRYTAAYQNMHGHPTAR